jgi:hypothetical protein
VTAELEQVAYIEVLVLYRLSPHRHCESRGSVLHMGVPKLQALHAVLVGGQAGQLGVAQVKGEFSKHP